MDLDDKVTDPVFRLCVYEAGHALVARALDKKILRVRMLPRPPETVTDKVFRSNDWGSFYAVLEERALELFGGQLAEDIACGSTTCCAGDISRIDELTRIMAGLGGGEENPEDIYFRLEEQAGQIFSDPRFREAIVPLADYLYDCDSAGKLEIAGAAIEDLIDCFVPRPEPGSERGLRRLLRRLKTG
ncbi:MAG: hypothetical protein H6907_13245 [Hyphomicrobiales bacterium]|nr:hypothetical protein [Hyphomicrobiales bacterium]MCP5372691.1 hypothetical protein [Hyphomicrobiales bacterium]